MENNWICYTKAEDILQCIQKLIIEPKKDRPVNYLIIGPTNNGKSRILNELLERNPPIDYPERDDLVVPVVKVEAPPMPGSNRLYNAIFNALNCPYRENGSASYKESKILKLFERLEVRVLLIDEFQHINAGSSKQQQVFLNTLKHFTNICKISIVAAGVEEAIYSIQSDSQIKNRFTARYLDRWTFGEDYVRLLMTLEESSAIAKKSKISRAPLNKVILNYSEGILGHIKELVEKLHEYCEKNDTDVIEKEFITKIDYQPPSIRNKF